MPKIVEIEEDLKRSPRIWLITGVAGFIGSNLLQKLLSLDQKVVGLDNFSTGHKRNLEDVRRNVGSKRWQNFSFREGDIVNLETARDCVSGVDVVLHQAALGSVPRSIKNPIATHDSNVNGFLNTLISARDAGVKRFIYAASSSTYGDHPGLPKVEDRIGKPLSPYAVTKYINELYAVVFSNLYGIETVGLRYFNVFGPRQDPKGAYAAVIPRWCEELISRKPSYIYGDGKTSRDFCYIDNTVQANILAATTDNPAAINQIYNVAFGARTTLSDLFYLIRDLLAEKLDYVARAEPIYEEFRTGDVRHSLADIGKAVTLLDYEPYFDVEQGLRVTAKWFIEQSM